MVAERKETREGIGKIQAIESWSGLLDDARLVRALPALQKGKIAKASMMTFVRTEKKEKVLGRAASGLLG